MYKFSNGVVVFTEEDKENFLKAGYVLVEDIKNENKDNGGVIGEEPRKSKKVNTRV